MLPGKKPRRNARPRPAEATPPGKRNLPPREPVVLPVEDDDGRDGGDFPEWESDWEPDLSAPLAPRVPSDYDDDGEGLSEAVARARAKREQARAEREEAAAAATPAADEAEVDEAGGADGDEAEVDEAEVEVDGAAPSTPLTAEEVRRRAKRDARVWKGLGDADRGRLREVADPAALAAEPGHAVLGHGAALRLRVEAAWDEHASLYHAPLDEPREARQARLGETEAAVVAAKRAVARYDAWVAENRPGLAGDELLDLLAGSKANRAAAKARLAGLDKKHRAAPGAKGRASAPAGASAALPLIYRAEYQGKVRAYPGWVAPVLREVARKRGHNVPAMALVLAQLAYWLRPVDGTGRPRARRAKLVAGRWWAVLGYGEIEKQTPVSLGQARRAVGHLKELGLVDAITAKDANVGSEAGGVDFGPNTVFLRALVSTQGSSAGVE